MGEFHLDEVLIEKWLLSTVFPFWLTPKNSVPEKKLKKKSAGSWNRLIWSVPALSDRSFRGFIASVLFSGQRSASGADRWCSHWQSGVNKMPQNQRQEAKTGVGIVAERLLAGRLLRNPPADTQVCGIFKGLCQMSNEQAVEPPSCNDSSQQMPVGCKWAMS